MDRVQNEALHLLVVLSRASQWVHAHSDKSIREYGLTRTEFGVLELLYHKGRQPTQQIGNKVLMSSGNITYTVDKLEKKGFVARKTCKEDRRLVYAEITERGKQFIEEVFPRHTKLIEEVLGGLSPEEMQTAAKLLKKLGKHAEESYKEEGFK
ncbi:MAG: MarR family transcriptional regulator [Paenibacillus macerans]|uniref:MarR family protein n=1 Tax=Paenibacillus macerans TaxID=44252 RepID=A0A090Y7R8_PAEMA|nr:MarR family transcriptional regulator [Paenibacillus macerans]KFM94231.1 marR family protein [Paenibacillus macerans]MCY7561850.1 MarR family transcriptional regulator [Paenibacillus macerans]MDU5947466.1 MarR family transcriptional regulator [Paenibacillus macerans]MDU7472425.1 MarR family transcriptional regulator [Paenibacillus macerans]MEC0137339.1 MarR family transcriptional regulator [Paenibacillus macerans]